jgi:kynurenine formamidase
LTRLRRTVDLSIPLDRQTPVYPGDPAPRIRRATTIETGGFNLLSLSIGSHAGTHVDAPYHMLEAGARLEDLDLGLFVGPLVVAEATGLEPRSPVTWERIRPVAERLGPGAILAIRTGWADLHRGSTAYADHPHLDPQACARVLDRGVRTIAIDALSPDPTRPDEPAFPVHELVLGTGGVIAENLANLGEAGPDALVCLFPIRLGEQADGAPCRAIALELELE